MLKGNIKFYSIIFQIWVISFPFGSYVLYISMGYFTLYPFLLLLICLFGYSFFFKYESEPIINKIVITFLSSLLIYALIRASISGFSSYAIFDIRSLILFLFTVFIIFRSNSILGWQKLKPLLGNTFILFFIIFTMIAVFEYLAGIHIWGHYVEKLLLTPITTEVTYTPVFIYDNPNNFITYYILIGVTTILLNNKIQQNIWQSSFIIVLLLSFSYIANSRFGVFTNVILIISIILINIKQIKTYIYKNKYSIILVLGLTLMCFFFNPIYIGPIWQKTINTKENILKQKEIDLSNQLESNTIRLKLIKNGIYLFKESNGFGVGPGMFRYYHDEKKVPENVFSHANPHNWIIELLSQYGFFCFFYIIFFIYMIWNTFLNYKFHKNYSIIFVASILIFFIISNSPSAFGLLDINWIFTGILILYYTSEIKNKSSNNSNG